MRQIVHSQIQNLSTEQFISTIIFLRGGGQLKVDHRLTEETTTIFKHYFIYVDRFLD